MRRLLSFWTFLLVVIASLLAAGPGEASDPRLGGAIVQLKWHHQTQFAGLYVAEQTGLYRNERLAVELRPWKVGAPSPIEEVTSGRAHFGITSQTQFLVERQKGAPIVAIAAIYQKSPVGFFALKHSGIKRPTDFVGKTIAFALTHQIHLRAMLKKVGVDPAALRPVPYSYDLKPFLSGQVAILGGYIMNQPVDARLAGHEVNVIFPDDYGVHAYDDIVFTSESVIARNPDLVERWLRASLRGWRFAVERPDEATEMTLKVDPTRRREKELAMLLASIPCIHTGEHPVGWMSRDVWDEMVQTLTEQKILAGPVAVDRAYTMTFLERVYRR